MHHTASTTTTTKLKLSSLPCVLTRSNDILRATFIRSSSQERAINIKHAQQTDSLCLFILLVLLANITCFFPPTLAEEFLLVNMQVGTAIVSGVFDQ